MPKIFISYRRDESAGYAGRIHQQLASVFGSNSVFMDVDDLTPGTEFNVAIDKAVSSSDVLLVLIGKQWLNVTDTQGKRRLDDPNDFVRREISAGLKRNVRVIPILLNNARLPSALDLPDDLKRLADHQAMEMTEARWDYDVDRLLSALGAKRRRRVKRALTAVAVAILAIAFIGYYAFRPRIDVTGQWSAVVPYEFSDPLEEFFDFVQSEATLTGTASFLKVVRIIPDGKMQGNRMTFTLKTSEEAGGERREAMHYYVGTVTGNEIVFVLQTEGGFSSHPPIRFVAHRRGPS